MISFHSSAVNAGVFGNHKADSGWGVRGTADNGVGVSGASKHSYGVIGESGVPDMGEQIFDPRTAGVYGAIGAAAYASSGKLMIKPRPSSVRVLSLGDLSVRSRSRAL